MTREEQYDMILQQLVEYFRPIADQPDGDGYSYESHFLAGRRGVARTVVVFIETMHPDMSTTYKEASWS